MEKLITLFNESAEVAFFLGTFLYALCFVGDLLVTYHQGRQDGPVKHG
jgi:hypothetical protein